MAESDDTHDLFSGPSDTQLLRSLLADLNDDLHGRIARYRYLVDLSSDLGEGGTMIFGGTAAHAALIEDRSSFVYGNFIATIFLCQALVENALAGFLHFSLHELPTKITFNETLTRCQVRGILSPEDVTALKRLAGMRNPLSHFRDLADPDNLMRRSITANEAPEELLSRDAHFAIATIIRLLANPPFRVGL